MDVDIETAVKRVRNRPNEKNRYIDMDLQYKLRDLYLKIAKRNNGVIINTETSPEDCFKIIKTDVNEVIYNV